MHIRILLLIRVLFFSAFRPPPNTPDTAPGCCRRRKTHRAADDRRFRSSVGRHSTNACTAVFRSGTDTLLRVQRRRCGTFVPRAAELDPQLAMAYWGVALAALPARDRRRKSERRKAYEGSVGSDQKGGVDASSDADRMYIDASSKLFSDDPKSTRDDLQNAYRVAMSGRLQALAEEPDAAALYALSIFYSQVGDNWTPAGKPTGNGQEMVERPRGRSQAFADAPRADACLHTRRRRFAAARTSSRGRRRTSRSEDKYPRPSVTSSICRPTSMYEPAIFRGPSSRTRKLRTCRQSHSRTTSSCGTITTFSISSCSHTGCRETSQRHPRR